VHRGMRGMLVVVVLLYVLVSYCRVGQRCEVLRRLFSVLERCNMKRNALCTYTLYAVYNELLEPSQKYEIGPNTMSALSKDIYVLQGTKAGF
jgi:hypothetical protein